MPSFDFTGPGQFATSFGTFAGGTTNPNIDFTYSFSGKGPIVSASFDGDDITFVDGSDSTWEVTLDLTFASVTPFTGLVFSTSFVSGFNVTTATTPVGGGREITFSFSGTSGVLAITSFNAQCFLTGTRIATPSGMVAIEELVVGDVVLTADGGKTTVQWLGEMPIDTCLSHPRKVNPICISAGALGDGLPEHDLYISADHAIAFEGFLINAGALVNGSSIFQVKDMPLDGFTYYHVETDAHELILAEGVAAESFIDYGAFPREGFVSAHEAPKWGPIAEMPLKRISSARLLPDAIKVRLGFMEPATTIDALEAA